MQVNTRAQGLQGQWVGMIEAALLVWDTVQSWLYTDQRLCTSIYICRYMLHSCTCVLFYGGIVLDELNNDGSVTLH
jgi:hypothetical protein